MANEEAYLFGKEGQTSDNPIELIDNGNGKFSLMVGGTLTATFSPGSSVSLLVGGSAISQTNPLPVSQTRVAGAAADVHVPAVNTAAVVTYAANATQRHVITGVAWSYSGGIPVGGRLTIVDNGVTVFDVDITDNGCGSFDFPRPKIQAAANHALVITLAAAGAAIYGKLSIENHWLE